MDVGSATMLSSEASDGCSGWVDSEVIGVVGRRARVHAWSLVAMVKSVVIATIVVVVVLLPLLHHLFLGMTLEPAELRSSMTLYLTQRPDTDSHPRQDYQTGADGAKLRRDEHQDPGHCHQPRSSETLCKTKNCLVVSVRRFFVLHKRLIEWVL